MRISLVFNTKEKLVMPIHYNYHIQGMIYNNISTELAAFLHDRGYIHGKRQFKLFTFSRLEGQFHMRKDRKIQFTPPVRLTVVSPVERFLTELSTGMLKNDKLNLCGQKLVLESVEVHSPVEEADFGDEVTIKMMSPVVAYNTVKRDDESKTFYFSPWEEWFSELIRSNLEKKYQLIQGASLKGADIHLKPVGPKDERYCKIIYYKDNFVKGWMGIYKMSGDKRLMKIAYDTGLGSKNPQGFGCFHILGGIRQLSGTKK
jgi:CRISPR-associated endoribonuclease Cas6